MLDTIHSEIMGSIYYCHLWENISLGDPAYRYSFRYQNTSAYDNMNGHLRTAKASYFTADVEFYNTVFCSHIKLQKQYLIIKTSTVLKCSPELNYCFIHNLVVHLYVRF